jgi:RNA polymerase sigma factor (TIGR02999 family)
MELPNAITDLIQRAHGGDDDALRKVFDAMYSELRGIARSRLRRINRDALLDTTSLVNEAYLRFAQSSRLKFEDRRHFLKYASHAMRSVIVDFVRERAAQRRGGGALHVTLDPDTAEEVRNERAILDVHDALGELAQHDPRLVAVVEMRYFGGMSETEIAEALEVTERTVRRDWQKARLLLMEALDQK